MNFVNFPNATDSPRASAPSASFERETDYRFKRFLEWSPSLGGRRVALYGSGANARRIIGAGAEERGFSIAAVVDDNAVGADVAGYVAVALDTALASGIDALVIAAEPKSVVAAGKRVYRSCAQADVQLFDMYGNDLMALAHGVEQSMQQAFADQLAQIEASEILCVNVDLLLDAQSERTIPECMADGLGIDRCMRFVIENALARGKRVILYATDYAVFSARIDAALARYGLKDACEVFYAMADQGLWAENGLYRFMLGKAPDDHVLFVGSDLFRDCYIPLMYGARSIMAGNPKDPDFYQVAHCSDEERTGDSWFDGARFAECGAAEDRLRACLASSGEALSASIGTPAARIVSVVAPLVIGYVTWLAACLEERAGEYDKVLFASRDAFVVYQVYDLYRNLCSEKELPPAQYFYTSRKASIGAAAECASLSDERRFMLEYFANAGLEIGKTYAFVEFVGAGTCQRQLSKFAPFRIDGYYFGSRLAPRAQRSLGAQSYFDAHDASFLTRYLTLEPFLSSCEPSLVRFSQGGIPVFAEEHRSARELEMLRAVHEGVLVVARDYFERYYETGDVVGHEFVNAIMPYLDACDTESMLLYDDLADSAMSKRLAYETAASASPSQKGAGARSTQSPADAQSVDRTSAERTVYDALLDLLAAFDEVCNSFDLTYVATHGTLLGAVRNGGFVPGDVDLDVAMPRADYDKLLELAGQGVFPEPFFLQTPENDAESFYGGYAKLRDASTLACPAESDERDSDKGIWMDIMPLDDCPAKDAALLRQRRSVRLWQYALYAKTYGIHHLWGCDPYKMSAYYALGDKLSRESLCKHLRKACTSAKATGLLTIFAGNYTGKRATVRFDAADIAAASRVVFEGTTIPIPAHAEAWLESYYGTDWETVSEEPDVLPDID